MRAAISMFAGALFSAAYIAPKPWCFVALGLSCVLVVLLRAR